MDEVKSSTDDVIKKVNEHLNLVYPGYNIRNIERKGVMDLGNGRMKLSAEHPVANMQEFHGLMTKEMRIEKRKFTEKLDQLLLIILVNVLDEKMKSPKKNSEHVHMLIPGDAGLGKGFTQRDWLWNRYDK